VKKKKSQREEKYFSKHCGLHKQVLALKRKVNREKHSRQKY
jgi:hypothetical protein